MAISAVSSTTNNQGAFGLDFQSLLRIILTQLTYQDPLKPVDNFQFVSQLAQFSQLQQSQTLNDQIASLISAQAATQATSLLGRTIDVATQSTTLSGVVQSVRARSNSPTRTPSPSVLVPWPSPTSAIPRSLNGLEAVSSKIPRALSAGS